MIGDFRGRYRGQQGYGPLNRYYGHYDTFQVPNLAVAQVPNPIPLYRKLED